ncbi:Lsr2 family DNA-binding protein, partial [Streptomyces bacillaris]
SLAPDPATVRAWARSHRMEVPARGRIPTKGRPRGPVGVTGGEPVGRPG